jgi:uncharacterized protein (TIGR02145 family)
MKREFLILSIISFCILIKAQPYSISFAGTGLSTVKVQNLTSGDIVNVPAGDVLLLSTSTVIPEINNMKSSELKVYPNPMTDKSTLEILPPVAGDAIISVCDITGKVLTQFKGYLENYTQEFSLSDILNGLHIINVQGKGYQFSEKLLSKGRSDGTASISIISNNIQVISEKKSKMDSKGIQTTVEMAYNSGERLKYTAVSGNNSTVITEIPTANKTVTFDFVACTDNEGNNYPVIKIGTQIWMAKNLAYLPSVNPSSVGSDTEPFYYVYDYQGTNVSEAKSTSNYQTYGVLYNWPAAMNRAASSSSNPSGVRGACPLDWHLPSHAEWQILVDYLTNNGYGYEGSGDDIAKSLASNTNWRYYDQLGTPGNDLTTNNSTGFSGLPHGIRRSGGIFEWIEFYAPWWASETWSENTTLGGMWRLVEYAKVLYKIQNPLSDGQGVRCIKD